MTLISSLSTMQVMCKWCSVSATP